MVVQKRTPTFSAHVNGGTSEQFRCSNTGSEDPNLAIGMSGNLQHYHSSRSLIQGEANISLKFAFGDQQV